MSFTLLVAGTIAMSGPTAVKFGLFGDEIAASPANSFKTLAQGSSSVAATTIYTVTGPVTQAIVKTMVYSNTAGTPSAVVIYANGTAAINQIFAATIPAGGTLSYGPNGWQLTDSTGTTIVTSTPITATGDATGVQSGSTLPLTLATFGPGAVGPIGSATQVAAVSTDAKGRVSALSAVAIQIAESQVTNLVTDLAGKQPTGNYITALTGDGAASGPGSATFTLATVNVSPGTFGSATQVAQTTVNGKGLATTVANVAIQIAESQVTNLVTDLAGKQPTGNYITALTGDITATGPGSAAATLVSFGPGAIGPIGSATTVAAVSTDIKGRVSALTGVAIQIAESQVTNLVTDLAAKVPTSRLINTTAPLSGGGDLSADRTLSILAATTAAAGSMSAIDKLKLDNAWIDVTANPTALVLTTNTAAQNITAINAILAAAPGGSVIYFPGQTFTFNAAWTMPAGKQFTFQGHGPGLSGGNTLLQWTSNVGGTWITLASSTFYYYFRNLTFVSVGVAQTAGAVVDVNGNATTNFYNCHFTGLSGGTLNDVLVGTNTGFGQSWNSTVISDCIMNSYKGRGVFIDSAGASLVIANSVIQGAWGPSSGGIFTGAPGLTTQAAAGVQANNCGALEINDCDILGNVNNLLLSPAVSQVNASCFVTNTYFDSSGGSCFKIAGAGATVRVRFDTCSFTTAGTNYSTPGSGFSAIENAATFVFAAGGQSVAFTNCNILNTFATAGTTNGVLIAGTWADWYFTNNNVAGWTNGFNSTPGGTNISMLKVGLGAVGASAGYGANSVGFLIGAGAYKGLLIQQVNARNNTTPLTLGAVTVAAGEGDYFRIQGNGGINPKMGAALTPPVATPVSTTVYTNLTGFTAQIFFKATTAISAMSINGVATVFVATTNTGWVTVEPGGTFAYTATGTLSWVWVGQ